MFVCLFGCDISLWLQGTIKCSDHFHPLSFPIHFNCTLFISRGLLLTNLHTLITFSNVSLVVGKVWRWLLCFLLHSWALQLFKYRCYRWIRHLKRCYVKRLKFLLVLLSLDFGMCQISTQFHRNLSFIPNGFYSQFRWGPKFQCDMKSPKTTQQIQKNLLLFLTRLFLLCRGRPNGGKVRHKRQALQDMARPLKQWLYKHRDNPYPTKTEKILLALGSQMTLVQVRNLPSEPSPSLLSSERVDR